jgi:hypothetical protein
VCHRAKLPLVDSFRALKFFSNLPIMLCMFNPIGGSQNHNSQPQTSTATQARAEPNPQHALPEDTVSLNSNRAGGVTSGSNSK